MGGTPANLAAQNWACKRSKLCHAIAAARDSIFSRAPRRVNDWNFYLGDTIWEPVADKLGTWRMTVESNGKIVADKSFELHADTS
jgi:hypothetical protein